jgi:hypothetical protein
MDIFMYGLFMDEKILLISGITIFNSRIAYLEDHALKIGRKATLVPCKGERSYGVVMTVDAESARSLYSGEGLKDYRPTDVHAVTEPGKVISALCYILPGGPAGSRDIDYIRSLYDVASKKGFPDDYLMKIKAMAIRPF